MANCLTLEYTDFNPFLMETHTATDATIKPQRMGKMVYSLALGRNDFIASVYVLFKSYNHTLVLLLIWGISFPSLFLSQTSFGKISICLQRHCVTRPRIHHAESGA